MDRKRNKNEHRSKPLDLYETLDEQNSEFAGEITPEEISEGPSDDYTVNYDEANFDQHTWLGWLAVVLSVLAFFWMPFILGTIGIILGIVARSQDLKVLGNTAIIVGAVVLILRLLILPVF